MKLRANENTVKAIQLLLYLLKDPTPKSLKVIASEAGDGNVPSTERNLHAFIKTDLVDRTSNGDYMIRLNAYELIAPYIQYQNDQIVKATTVAREAYQSILKINHKMGEVA